jgi:hypothetical protein
MIRKYYQTKQNYLFLAIIDAVRSLDYVAPDDRTVHGK